MELLGGQTRVVQQWPLAFLRVSGTELLAQVNRAHRTQDTKPSSEVLIMMD